MKKYIYAALAAATMLGAASCSNDDAAVQQPAGDGTVVFTAEIPAIGSRAYGDGTTATNLTAYVYSADGDATEFLFEKTATFDGLHATVELQLVTGKTYDVVFWAKADGAPYSYDTTSQTVTVTYTGTAANDEKRDAFFVTETGLTVSGPIQKTVQLKRPFAQLNVLTTDYAEALASEVKVKQTGLTMELPATLNLATGEVGGAAEVTLDLADLPSGTTVVNGKTYTYLSMNYILAAADKAVADVKVATDFALNSELSFTAVPVQRNFRTNIYGALLTNPAVFDVEILPGFDGEHNSPVLPAGTIRLGNNDFETLAEAIAAVTADNNVIELGDGTFSTNDLGKLKASATFKAAGGNVVFEMPRAVTVTVPELNFDGITLVTPNSNYIGFQHTNKVSYSGCTIKNMLFLYGTQETFDNCTFINNNDYNVWTYGASTATFNNCTFGEFGKGLLVYLERSNTSVINVNDCKFKSTASQDGKAAIEVDCERNAAGDNVTININNTTSEGYSNGSVSGNPLWNVKKGTQYVVTVDGVEYRGATVEP